MMTILFYKSAKKGEPLTTPSAMFFASLADGMRSLTQFMAGCPGDAEVEAAFPGISPIRQPPALQPVSFEDQPCCHCGSLPWAGAVVSEGKVFCCQGCRTVFELLAENGLGDFYRLGKQPGVQIKTKTKVGDFKFLDDPTVRERLVDFADAATTRVTFRVPAVHCIACVWLLENLFRLKPGIGRCRVNFPRKEVSITFENSQLELSDVAALLASLGYPPELKLSDLAEQRRRPTPKRLWMQLGVAGFAFGNIMLLSISSYLGLDRFYGPGLERLFGYISLALALPVLLYSAADYWRGAWRSLRRRTLNIEMPIALGILALVIQSAREVFAGGGLGYLDSLSGLVFFLLCGKLFQQKTYDRLAFDLDYRSFFPLSVTRKNGAAEEQVALAQLRTGDRLLVRNGELIPADARLVGGPALIDYSFVTGESEPAARQPEDHLYAGGRQVGGAIELETVKPVSHSYLASLWDQEAFRKEKCPFFDTLTNRYSRLFTPLVIAIALISALVWSFVNPALSLKSFASVLIVACPCALALAAPFALGTAQRVLARRNVFLKNAAVLETLARVDAMVFDKTGTLTAGGGAGLDFEGAALSEQEERWVYSLTRHSTHPLAVRLGQAIAHRHVSEAVRSFIETPGCGMEGSVSGHQVWLGAAAWLEARGLNVPANESRTGSVVHLAIDGAYRGSYSLANALRPEMDKLAAGLADDFEIALLSGDTERERARFTALFGPKARLFFTQSPFQKLEFIRRLQQDGRTVMMVGDGLNDAGALQQSDVGAAVVEKISAFSPASDIILGGRMVARLAGILRYSRQCVRVVRASFLLSALYNIVGIAVAARGLMSPIVCAVLMPLSSVSVVVFASGAAAWLGRRLGQPEEPA